MSQKELLIERFKDKIAPLLHTVHQLDVALVGFRAPQQSRWYLASVRITASFETHDISLSEFHDRWFVYRGVEPVSQLIPIVNSLCLNVCSIEASSASSLSVTTSLHPLELLLRSGVTYQSIRIIKRVHCLIVTAQRSH